MKNKSSLLRKLYKGLGSTAILISLIVLFRTLVFDWSVVPSGSMTHTFLIGDVVINNKLAYRYDPCSIPIVGVYLAKKRIIPNPGIKRGDIIVFCSSTDYITKRVVGLPGDQISWDHVDLIINGESTVFDQNGNYLYPNQPAYTLDKSHHDLNIDEVMTQIKCRIPIEKGLYKEITTLHSAKQKIQPLRTCVVPKGTVMVVGDNRFPQYSWDSRDHKFGFVPISMVTGRVDGRLFGTKAKIFNRNRKWIHSIIMFPYLALRYISSIDLRRFGSVESGYIRVDSNNNLK